METVAILAWFFAKERSRNFPELPKRTTNTSNLTRKTTPHEADAPARLDIIC